MSRTFFHALEEPPKAENGLYKGVLIIRCGNAKGHYMVKTESGLEQYDSSNESHKGAELLPVQIAPETVEDVAKCAEGLSIKCKLDHGSTVKDIVGEYKNFRVDGDCVRADLELMQSSPHKNYVEELFEKMSNSVGNSIDFAPRYELVNGKAIARCQVLNSVDIVDSPAATKSLFEEKPEPSQYMALSPEDFDKIAEIVKAQVAACMEAAKPQEAPQELAEEAKPEEKPEEAPKEEMACEDEKMSALVEKATLSAVQKLFPKAALTNLNAAPAVVDEYSEKLNACLSAGMSEAHAILHIARKFPKVHNQKFSQGVTQTNAKL